MMEKRELNTQENILYEIKSVLAQEENQDKECISLYDIANLIKEIHNREGLLKKEYKTHFRKILRDKGLESRSIVIYNFDYEKKQLRIGYKYLLENYDIIAFSKENGELRVVESNVLPSYQQELMGLIGKELSELYDKFMLYLDFNSQVVERIDSVNSNFIVKIARYGTRIFVPSDSNKWDNFFDLFHNNYDTYSYNGNFDKIMDGLKGHEDNLFKRLYAKIEECPEWSREMLYKIREEQLNEKLDNKNFSELENSKEEEPFSLVRNFFNWLKKQK